jgi:hypothetical protein
MGESAKATIIPEKILEEVAFRKKCAEQGIIFIACQKRRWGSRMADALLNDTVDAEIVPLKELPPAKTEP